MAFLTGITKVLIFKTRMFRMHVKDAKEDVKYLLETGLFLFFLRNSLYICIIFSYKIIIQIPLDQKHILCHFNEGELEMT